MTSQPATSELILPSPASVPQDAARSTAQKVGKKLRSLIDPPRITGLDIARAVAVVGMIGAHIGATDDAEMSLWDPSTWDQVVHGRSSILFAVVAGVSLALMTSAVTRDRTPETMRIARLSITGRAMAIFGIGVALELLGTPVAVILTAYAVFFLAAVPFIGWSSRRLMMSAAVALIMGPLIQAFISSGGLGGAGSGTELVVTGVYPLLVWLPLMMLGLAIGRCDLAAPRAPAMMLLVGAVASVVGYGVSAQFGLDSAKLDEGLSIYESASGSDLSLTPADEDDLYDPGTMETPDMTGLNGDDLDVSGMMCDVDVDNWVSCYPPEDYKKMINLSDDLSYVDSDDDPSMFRAFQETFTMESFRAALLSSSPHSGGLAEVVGSGGVALMVLGGSLLLGRSKTLRRTLFPLAAVGSMPLTAYAAHVIVIACLGSNLDFESHMPWLWTVVGLLLGCSVWAATVGRGPLERLVAFASRSMSVPRVSRVE